MTYFGPTPMIISHGRHERTEADKCMKWAHKAVFCVQLSCLIITLARTQVNAKKTLTSDLWNPTRLSFNPILQRSLENCSVSNTVRVGALNKVPVGSDEIMTFADLAGETKLMLVLNSMAIFVGLVNKILFDYFFHHYVYRFIIIRKDLLSVAELLLLVWSIVEVSAVDQWSSQLRFAFDRCGIVGDDTLPFASPHLALYVSLSAGLAALVLPTMCHIWRALRHDESEEINEIRRDPRKLIQKIVEAEHRARLRDDDDDDEVDSEEMLYRDVKLEKKNALILQPFEPSKKVQLGISESDDDSAM